MTNYQKLIDVGAIWDVAPGPKPSTFYGIELPDSKRSDRTICIFIDIVFQAIQYDHVDIPFPDKVTASLGKNSITFDEYLENLRAGGFDVDALLEKGAAAEKSLNESITNRKTKAATFFKLIQNQFVVDDDDVRKYIDGDSIYDLMQLVLDHADSTRARLMAVKRHTENHAMKSEVFKWLDANMVNFNSMDSAAEAITKQQPIKFRTARDWTGEWKKLRSASTP